MNQKVPFFYIIAKEKLYPLLVYYTSALTDAKMQHILETVFKSN